ncbi:MAG: Hpt domain-containing protein [Proteobacteria bacterium]|nr:Hpt domain-containing protein [Pseudomonadota bacterium]MBI3497161.1 Hpt domain-containing protein [Pseudomonadota bacterium]
MAEYVKPPKHLSDKTGKGVPGGAARVVKKADEAVKRHQQRVDYRRIAQPSLDGLIEALNELTEDPNRAEAAKRIYELAHNLKGEGGSFGYPAVSQVAALLSQVAENVAQADPRKLAVIQLQIDSLRAIVRSGQKGRPEGLTQEVINSLEMLVSKYLTAAKGRAAS